MSRLSMIVAMAVPLCAATSPLVAATIYEETFESYTPGVWADATGTNGGWRLNGAVDGGDVVGSPVFAGSQAGLFDDTSALSANIWNRFNTGDDAVATDPVWVEAFVNYDSNGSGSWGLRVPQTGNIASSRLQVGFIPNDADESQLFVSGAALATTFSNLTIADGDWLHFVVEIDFNGAASTAKVYARTKSAGDTSPLSTSDLLTLGSSDSVTFSWNGSQLDALMFFKSSAGTLAVDNLAVHTHSPIVIPEPMSLVLLGLALPAVVLRRRGK